MPSLKIDSCFSRSGRQGQGRLHRRSLFMMSLDSIMLTGNLSAMESSPHALPVRRQVAKVNALPPMTNSHEAKRGGAWNARPMTEPCS